MKLEKISWFLQAKGTEIKTVKEHLADTIKDRLKTIFKTKLSAVNIAKAINTSVLPPLTSINKSNVNQLLKASSKILEK